MQLGKDITSDELVQQLSFFTDWEEKYSYIIDLGKSLPKLEENDYNDNNIIKGCQSKVWLTHQTCTNNQQSVSFEFFADSDALIVKGLLAIILVAYNHKSAEDILAFDMDAYFQQLDLLSHVSNVRGNGLKAMVQRIRDIAVTDVAI